MENRAHALFAGLFTILLLTAAILGAIWLSRDRTPRLPYEIATTLPVPGLSPQASVRYRGLTVGRVDAIGFDPQMTGRILLRMSIAPDAPITRSTFATLAYQGVTGIAYVELDDDGSNAAPLPSMPGNVARIPLRPSLLSRLQDEGLALLAQTRELTQRINGLVSPDNEKALLATVAHVDAAAQAFGDMPRQLQPTLERLPALVNQAQQSLAALGAASRRIDTLAGDLQAQNGALARVGAGADALGLAADRLGREVQPLADDVRSSLRLLDRTLNSLNERPQSLLFGRSRTQPGPGEPGYVAPAP
jgi:phospholipid/cholesterol/gamma-HCH transport system substrate-binding protein